ncbi:zinc ribbon domain-containing protein [Clostridium sp.]|uniref:zinc ribbon domain-containing protein n=1 Tax=Clostridium sp. TaxID=1506 RepID=UPI00351FD9A0
MQGVVLVCAPGAEPTKGIYYRSYRCELKNRAANRCDSKMVNADELENFIIDLM